MTNAFDVSPEELRSHASRLDALSDQLKTALDAANQVTMGTEAYGVICSFFVPIVQAVSQPGVDALSTASESMSDQAGNVKDTAQTYESGDQANADSFSGWEV
ncbi:type VII secretion target [Saccharopolyspora sp. NPDC050389]|uniref:type VII secretion target n=1 Tax=Saccharopolyspora sp. NPDC050389 TaxID=3155516 RepID=UPI0033FA597F